MIRELSMTSNDCRIWANVRHYGARTPNFNPREDQMSAPVDAVVLPLELALVRWSVVHRRWHDIGGDCPHLQGFLAGWFCREIGAKPPVEVARFRDSFNCGWREADDQIAIESRRQGP